MSNVISAYHPYQNTIYTGRSTAISSAAGKKSSALLPTDLAQPLNQFCIGNTPKSTSSAGVSANMAPLRLDSDTIDDLASRYDCTDMSQEEYDQLLDELLAAGELTEEDLKLLGHSRYASTMTPIDINTFKSGYLADLNELPPGNYIDGFYGSIGIEELLNRLDGATSDVRINVLYWAQQEKSQKHYDPQTGWTQDEKAQAFQKLYDILQRM